MIGELFNVRRQPQAKEVCRVVHDSVDVGEGKENSSNIIQNRKLVYRNDQWKWRKTLLKD